MVLVSAHLPARAHVTINSPRVKILDGGREGEESSSSLGNGHGGTAAQLRQGQLQTKSTVAVRQSLRLHACYSIKPDHLSLGPPENQVRDGLA